MRTRIKSMLIDGRYMPIVKHTTFFGEQYIAALATSETPQHAKSSIRKILAHKKTVIRRGRYNPTPSVSERRDTFLTLGKEMYRYFYGLN
jgi:hypothetical protein